MSQQAQSRPHCHPQSRSSPQHPHARLVDDEWHETIHTTNGSAADTYERAVETALSSIDGGAQYLGETWDGADPEKGVSYRPLYYSQGDFDTARNMYQVAADHMAQLLAAN